MKIRLKHYKIKTKRGERCEVLSYAQVPVAVIQMMGQMGLSEQDTWVYVRFLLVAASMNNDTIPIPDNTDMRIINILNDYGSIEILDNNSQSVRPLERLKKERKKERKAEPQAGLPITETLSGSVKLELNSKPSTEKIFFDISGQEFFYKREAWDSWINTFPSDWVDLEFKKAKNWLLANKSKSPKKNFEKFFNNWLNNGWERHRKSLPSRQRNNEKVL